MFYKKKWCAIEIVFLISAWLFVMVLQGAVPFIMIPTLGQAVWTAGYAESFTHGSIFTIYAHDFGLPQPAAIAFGLAGAWPMSVLLRLGLHAADAYSMMMLLWLSAAFFSAYFVARRFNNTRVMSVLGAVVWLSMPIIWNHSGYSMLSLGISLLSLYFLAGLNLLCIHSKLKKPSCWMIFWYLIIVVISVFMDGYTFMMFFCGVTILFFYQVKTQRIYRSLLWRTIFPVHIASFIIAYLLFSVFIGQSHFPKASIDFFRGWGLDLSFVAIPTKGMHWIPDLLGFSMARPEKHYFGDGSVWCTTFSLPIILAGFIAWWLMRRKAHVTTGVLIIACFAFYMSLGPSLKIYSLKPPELSPTMRLMPAELAVMPTGNAWMDKALPGFNNMRAVYRWSALGIFSFWLLTMIAVSAAPNNKKTIWRGVLIVLIILNLPNLPKKIQDDQHFRDMFLTIDRDLISQLKHSIEPNERVVFLPWGNDFFANYLAPATVFYTYNIGGDKNLAIAQEHWPAALLNAGPAPLDAEKILSGIQLLRDKNVDVVVLPYFDMLWAAHTWPCTTQNGECIEKQKQALQPFIQQLRAMPDVVVTTTSLFATVRLKSSLQEIKIQN